MESRRLLRNTAGGDIYTVASILKSRLFLRMMNYSNLYTLTIAFENEMFLYLHIILNPKTIKL